MPKFLGLRKYMWNEWLTWLPGNAIRVALLCFLFKTSVGQHTRIWRGIKLDGYCYGNIVIGKNCEIPRGALLNITAGLTVGDNVILGHDVSFYGADHDPDSKEREARYAPIFVGDDVWIASKAAILKGVRINNGAVVAFGAVVTRDVDENAIVGGVPARYIRRRQIPGSGTSKGSSK
jgi:acetyltransferase-like isoleucine patch superfamily enzyme